MKFVENAPRVRARAIAILRRTGALDNDDLVWLLKHFPSFMEDSHKNLQFICKDPWHRGRGELVFLDIDESDDRESKSIKWLFDVGGVQLHEFSCIGKRITLGFSTHKYFDPFWWYCGDKSQYHPDEKPIRRLDVDYPTEPYESDFPRRLERQINRSYLNPNVRAVQVVEFVEEARVAVEVEFLCGSVHRGWLTWCNSD